MRAVLTSAFYADVKRVKRVIRQLPDYISRDRIGFRTAQRFGICLYLPLRRQAVACDLLHLFAKTIQFAKRGVDVRHGESVRWRIGRDANALKLLVNDGHCEDVMFVEQILNNVVRF